MFIYVISILFSILVPSNVVEMTSIVNIDTSKVLAQVDERYLSVALGMINKNWKKLDLNNERVINMAKALSPAFIRLGGTGADLATFNETHESNYIPEIYDSPNISPKDKVKDNGYCRNIELNLQKNRKNVTMQREGAPCTSAKFENRI